MSIQSKVHFWRFTLRRRWILMRMIFCGNGVARAKILKKSGVFGAMGDNCWYEPHKLPSEPQLVFMGNNVNIAADVAILNHDIMAAMINRMDGMPKCNIRVGGVTIGNNVNIGDNVIIGAGSVVTRDIPSGSVAVGCPAKVIGKFEDSVERYIAANRKK